MSRDIIVIHETNGRKYFEAISELKRQDRIDSVTFVEASVTWKLIHSLVRERATFASALMQAWRNLVFRITCFRLRDKFIVIGLPPWDYRFPLYSFLRHSNSLIYQTSWPYWGAFRVPRPNRWAGRFLRSMWLKILNQPNVQLIAVTTEAAIGLASVLESKDVMEIPHVVSDAFFSYRSSYRKPFRLLFVGELVEQRGLFTLADMIAAVGDKAIILDIVGDGPLRQAASDLVARTGGTWHKHVSNRDQMARIMSSSQLLISPSIRTKRWEELFGMAIIEAMACSVPCIASDHIGPRSVIENGVSGVLLPENSPLAIADWVNRFLKDEALWTEMSYAARLRAESSRLRAVVEVWDMVLQQT